MRYALAALAALALTGCGGSSSAVPGDDPQKAALKVLDQWPGQYVSVNFSPRQFRRLNFVGHVVELLLVVLVVDDVFCATGIIRQVVKLRHKFGLYVFKLADFGINRSGAGRPGARVYFFAVDS